MLFFLTLLHSLSNLMLQEFLSQGCSSSFYRSWSGGSGRLWFAQGHIAKEDRIVSLKKSFAFEMVQTCFKIFIPWLSTWLTFFSESIFHSQNVDNFIYFTELFEKWNEIIYAAYLLPVFFFLHDSILMWGAEGSKSTIFQPPLYLGVGMWHNSG